MVMPASPTADGLAAPSRTSHDEHYGKSNQILEEALLSAESNEHPLLFTPKTPRRDGWLSALRASQNPNECSRYLLIDDDMHRSGLGFTARMLASVLLYAVRHRRVLLEVPHRNKTTGKVAGRWCDRPPHTLQCAFEPWSSCALPDATLPVVAFEKVCQCPENIGKCHEHKMRCLKNDVESKPVVSMNLRDFFKLKGLWERPGESAFEVLQAAHRLLFFPRLWVRDLAACVMERYGLKRAKFMSVHVRISPEKEKESRGAGKRMPKEVGYRQLTRLAAVASGLRHVHLQTSNPIVLSSLVAWSEGSAGNFSFAYTTNPRQEGDAWGGWSTQQGSSSSTELTVAAVNFYIATQAAIFISPVTSIWTIFIMQQLGYDAERARWPAICALPGMPWTSTELDEASYSCGPRESYLKLVVRRAADLSGTVSGRVRNGTLNEKTEREGCIFKAGHIVPRHDECGDGSRVSRL